MESRPPDNRVGEVRPIWRDEGGSPTVGAPFLAVLDLPLLPDQETDSRPLVAVAAEPWRPMSVWAGGGSGSLSLRAAVSGPATIGRLSADLGPGVTGRWDVVNSLMLDVEGISPSSLSAEAVLSGGNAIAVQTSEGWEILQFRQASLIGGRTWRLSGLLRGLQGTEDATRAGAEAGRLCVFLDRSLARADVASGEIGLPLIWTAGQRGGPAYGSGVSVVNATLSAVHGRPFNPAHLRLEGDPAGRRIRWIPRTRLGGDVWEGEPVLGDPNVFRVSILRGAERLRSWEVEGSEALYEAGDIEADFSEGIGADAWVSVAQGDGRLGWGAEARAKLVG